MKKAPYVVLARRSRPKTFDEVLGQPAVSVTLKNALAAKRIAQAYLFTGPRGVGKTTMARILAKGLNCVKGPTPEPCGACPACTEIAASSSLDVLEMDAASHTGIDNIREVIIETVGLAPARDRYKVFIIDETHMLSTASFNALLKTLEEPPPHVVFILATTELSKVPATIASRCQRFKFRPVSVETLAPHLKALAAQEKIDIAPEALELLARSADGSLRDAVSLLDQCRSFSDKKITPELVREMFGFVPQELLLGLARTLVDKDARALAQWLDKVYEEGVDPSQVLRDLRSALEGVYLEKLGLEARAEKAWAGVMKDVPAETVAFYLRRFNEILAELRGGDAPRLTLELGLFGCLEAAGDLQAWVERLEALERRLAAGGAPAASRPAAPAPAVIGQVPAELWHAVMAQIRGEKPLLAVALESARLSAEGGRWTLFFARSFELDQAKSSQALIEAKLATLGGRPQPLSFELGRGDAPVPAPARDPGPSVPRAAPEQGEPEPEPEPGQAPGSSLKRAEKILGGTARFIKKKSG